MKICVLAHVKLWLIGSVLLLMACDARPNRLAEKPIESQVWAAKTAVVAPAVPSPPPTPAEIYDTVTRVLGTNVVVEGKKPVALTGDFNGDSFSDLVVVVTPESNKLADINGELANWQIQAPRRAYVPPRSAEVAVLPNIPRPERVKKGEPLLLVIHGDGPSGWRDPLARQTYLLREVAGDSLEVGKPSAALIRDFGQFPSARDVICETLGGIPGVIYWTGASYAWHAEEQETRPKPRFDSARNSTDRQARSASIALPAGSSH